MAPHTPLLAVALLALASIAHGQVVGRACNEAPECGTGAFCGSQKTCQCLYTYITSGGYCLQKVNPDEPGCSSNIQCSGVWPGALCNSGTCKCPNNQPAFISRDGPICMNYGSCPINGNYKLTVNNIVQQCTFGIDASCLTPTYECLCNQANCLTPAGAITFCCPTRAFACSQPFDSGTGGGGGSSTRYYYNSLSGSCQTFSYSGGGGNANNFQTLEQCQSYCQASCTRGQPLYRAAVAPSVKETIVTCSTTTSTACATNYACQDTGRGSYCCPTAQQVCCTNCAAGSKGGVQYNNGLAVPTTAYDAGINRGNGVTFIRYYYDSGLGRCTTFTYQGQGGNFNNFASQTECEQFCSSSLCTAGNPLKDGTGVNNIQCPASSCPTTHTCTSSVCCPTKQTLCSLPLAQGGPCSSIATRWWYNSATGSCQQFQFTGCQGNDNNFATFTACSSFCGGAGAEPQCPQGKAARDTSGNFINCGPQGTPNPALCAGNSQTYACLYDGTRYGCCPTQSFTCSLTADAGTTCVSSTTISRWAYSSSTRTCSTFTYGGCDGNSNNFATQQDCLDYCQTGGCPNGGEVYTVSGAPFVCGASACPTTHTCTTVSLGSLTTTYQYCCPTRSYICRLPRNVGIACGVGTLTRYYFDSTSRQCVAFQFNGCQGNRNSFSTLAQCRNYCYSADCADGQVAAMDTTSGAITTCTGGTCSTGYTCVASALIGQSICCGSPAPANSCPADRPNAFIDPLTTTVMNCIPNLPATCPSNNICNFANNNYYCCGFGAQVCPNGGSPFINPTSNLAIQCVPGTPNNCAAAGSLYTCQTRTANIGGVSSTVGTCCSPGPVDVCGAGYTATLLNGVPAPCNPQTANICPSPATCRLSPSTTSSYYCCTLTGVTVPPVAVCNGLSPYSVGGAPVICNNGVASTNCPSPYSCIYYSPTNVYYCCTGGSTGGAGTCPTGYTTSVTNGVANRCSPSTANSCGGNNLCQFVTQYNGYVCCIAGGTVPVPAPVPVPVPVPSPGGTDPFCSIGTAYLYTGTTLPLACTIGGPACPASYTCQTSRTGQGNICCTSGGGSNPSAGTGGCPASTPNPYWYDAARTLPLGCTVNGNPCPNGYRCVTSTRYAGSQCCQ